MDSHFIKAIQRVFRLDEDILNIIYDKIEVLEFPARYKLIKSGTVANKIYLIEKGACRSYYLKDDKEITTWFTFEFDFTTSFYSFISNEPSNETIELLEDSIVHALRFEDLNELTSKHPAINHLYRKVLEQNFVRQEKLLMERFATATEKYQNLVSKYPEILQRVSLGHIASFLGITQSTLSRIRRK